MRSVKDIEDRLLRVAETVANKPRARYNGNLSQETQAALYRLVNRAVELENKLKT